MGNNKTKDFREYNENLCKLTISKENVRRIYFTVFLLFIAGLISIIFSKIEFLEIKNNNHYLVLGLFEVAFAIAFLLISVFSIKNKSKKAYKYIAFSFWSLIIVFGIFNSVFSEKNFFSILPFFLVLSAFCLIPYFHKSEIVIFSGFHIIALLICGVEGSLSYTEIIYCLIFLLLSAVSASVRYNNYKLNFRYKSKLNVAIRQSETDKLTSLLNRRGLEREIYDLWYTWIQEKTNIAVIMLDIDFFKKYNDAFGHVEGDVCIKKVAKQIRGAIRKNVDFAARVGGEEFIICLSDINEKDSVMWAKRLKSSIEELMIPQATNNFLPYLTISCGLVCVKPSINIKFEDLYNAADKELYYAKENGRACLVYKGKCYDQRLRTDYTSYSYGTNLKYKI